MPGLELLDSLPKFHTDSGLTLVLILFQPCDPGFQVVKFHRADADFKYLAGRADPGLHAA